MEKQDFNQGWLFWKEGENTQQKVNLPHDAMIHEKRDPNCANAHNSGFYPGGKYYYKKVWNVPAAYKDKCLMLEFDGVYLNAKVFINGEEAAYRPNGYVTFTVSCEDYLYFDEDNEIIVEVDNSQTPNSRWYTGSGIYRPVFLWVANKQHICHDGIRVETLSHEPPRIRVRTTHTGGEVKIKILYNDRLISTAVGDDVEISISNGKLWSSETPELYQCQVSLLRDEEVIDTQTTEFGIRTLSWSKEGFFVNGLETKLRGACVHHDNGMLGACAFAEAEARKVRLLKQAGFNAIRSSHNPCSKSLLEAADRYGMYIIDEYSDVWYVHKQRHDYAKDFDEWHVEDLRSMVLRDSLHPSVIMYSIGNEIAEVWEEKGVQVTKELAEICRELDNTRPVTIGTNLMICNMAKKGIGVFKATDSSKKNPTKKTKIKKGGRLVASEFYNVMINIMGTLMDKQSKKKGCDAATAAHFAQVDICGYNYATIRYRNEPELYPNRIIVGSETRPPNIVENWRTTLECKHVIGDFMWTGWDYLGEAGIGTVSYSSQRGSGLLLKKYPYLLSGAGIIDICGHFRPDVWLNRAAWGTIGPSPYIGVEPVIYGKEKAVRSMWRRSDAVHSWSWHGFEGYPARIVVYSGATSVELFLNGNSLGKKVVKDCAVHFKTKYDPGELIAVNYDANGKEIGRDVLRTAGTDARLLLKAEKTTLLADGQDLCFLHIFHTDSDGEVLPANDIDLQVQVCGSGFLQGLGSANPYTEEGFYGGYTSNILWQIIGCHSGRLRRRTDYRYSKITRPAATNNHSGNNSSPSTNNIY